MKRTHEGGYDAWGVRLPNGDIRQFGTKMRATTFARRMEGQAVIRADGAVETWTGLTVVHRFIPPWEEVDL